ncbi:MAG TPA: hypothetical protein PKE51_06620 [Gemmatimonadaceae bacterium]|nr:hypothetical protein [Gemmatimonadaceae bacterium]
MTAPSAPASSPLGPAGFCAACGAGLAPGGRFCHRCGTPVGEGLPAARAGAPAAAASGGLGAVLPWGVAFVALMALVAMVAGRNFGAARGSQVDGSANALPTQAIDGPALGAGGGGPAPDISSMGPEERADRLYERIMVYQEAGKTDSVMIFAPMGLAAHELLPSIDLDRRYHAGRIAEAAGLSDMALAQADTILQQDADHLLGLILGARAARLGNDETKARTFDERLLRVLDAQRARQLPEYDQHRAEIELALRRARGES